MTAKDANDAKQKDDAGVLITIRESTPAVRALLLGVFINRLAAFLNVYLLLFLTHRGFTGVQAAIALGIFGGGSVVGGLLGGSLSDALGPRRTIILGTTGTGLLVASLLYLPNYPTLICAVAAVGVVSSMYRPANASMLAEHTPKHRQVMMFAVLRLTAHIGLTAAPLIGAVLLAISYNLLFWAEAATTFGYAVVALVALPRDQDRPRKPAPKTEDAQPVGGYRAMLADRRYVLYLTAMLINAAVYVQYLGTLPLAMRDAGLETVWFATAVTLNTGIVLTCELLVTRVVQHWPARVVIAIGFTLMGAGFAFYALPLGLAAFLIGTLGWTLAEIIGGPMMFAYPAKVAPPELRGRYIGATHAMFGVGTAIGPPLGVAIYLALGNQVWVWCGVLSAFGLAAAWYGMGSTPAGTRPAAEREVEPLAEPVPETPAEAPVDERR